MLMRTSILVLVGALAFTTGPRPATAQPQDGQIVVVPGDHNGVAAPPHVGVGVMAPGQAGQPGHAGASGSQTSAGGDPPPVCDYTPASQTPEQMQAQFPDWNAGTVGGGGKAVYYKKCGGRLFGWVTGPGAGEAQVLPSPEQLAAQAYDALVLPLPVPRHSPDVRLADGRQATIVGEHTWIWTDPGVWSARSKRVEAGPIWAEVTARPQVMSFDSGLAGTRSCSGPGTPYARSYGLHAASPDCDFVYPQPSVNLAGDHVTARYTITWHVTWVGSTGSAPAGGSLPTMTSRASAMFTVAEAQALRTS
ncbi:hypothetical protein GCM10029964_089980 [Kibdelosporangium lantanae]